MAMPMSLSASSGPAVSSAANGPYTLNSGFNTGSFTGATGKASATTTDSSLLLLAAGALVLFLLFRRGRR